MEYLCDKSLKIPEVVNRRTDRTMTKRKKKDKWTNDNLQNIIQKTKDRATRMPLWKTGGELTCITVTVYHSGH